MKILLFGQTGQVGWELQRSLSPLGSLVVFGRDQADFSDPLGLATCIGVERPDVIVNAVAHTAVDKAEAEPDLAIRINTEAPRALAHAAADTGALLVHYSTDYVFDGTRTLAYSEDDETHPQSVYGRSKRDGEDAIRASGAKHLIFRTSWVHAPRGKNFVKTMLRLARERDKLTVVADQYGAPTGAELIADVTALAIRAVEAGSMAHGTYHLTAAGRASWHDFACFIIGEARAAGIETKTTPEAIEAIATAAYPTPAKRPTNSVLSSAKLERALGITMPDWRHHARRTVRELLENQGP